MVKIGNECLLANYMSSRDKNYYDSLLHGSVVPTKLLLKLLNTLSMEDEQRSTLRITGRDTAQTKRILMRLVHVSSLDSRLHHPGEKKKNFARHPYIESVLSCYLCQCCTHDSSFLLSPHFTQKGKKEKGQLEKKIKRKNRKSRKNMKKGKTKKNKEKNKGTQGAKRKNKDKGKKGRKRKK